MQKDELKQASEKESSCQKCGGVANPEYHCCPYLEDINDDHETQCNCCPDCTQECANDI